MEEHGEQVEEIELLRFCLDKLQFYKKIPVRAKCLIVIDFIPIVVVAPPPSTSWQQRELNNERISASLCKRLFSFLYKYAAYDIHMV